MDRLSGTRWVFVLKLDGLFGFNGPFPAGKWPDINIARLGLIQLLDAGEYYAADGGYSDGHQFASTPNGLNDYEQRTKALARARHETVNRCFTLLCFMVPFFVPWQPLSNSPFNLAILSLTLSTMKQTSCLICCMNESKHNSTMLSICS